jgi:hypothetical protein
MRRILIVSAALALASMGTALANARDTEMLLHELAPLAKAHSFRADYVVDVRGEPERITHGEFVAPDRVRERDDHGNELIFIGSEMYAKYPAGWKRTLAPPNTSGYAQTLNLATLIRQAKSDYTLLGTELAGGASLHLYQHVIPPTDTFPGETTRIWIDASSHVLRKVETSSGNVTQTMIYSAWNAPLSIAAPALRR